MRSGDDFGRRSGLVPTSIRSSAADPPRVSFPGSAADSARWDWRSVLADAGMLMSTGRRRPGRRRRARRTAVSAQSAGPQAAALSRRGPSG